MAFNLKRVLKALLFSTSQPLDAKDIQELFARFHEAGARPAAPAGEGPAGAGRDAASSAAQPSGEAPPPVLPVEEAELAAEPPDDPELYQDVPSLVTGAQIREAMDEIAAELQASGDGLLLIEGASGYRLVTHPRFARWVRILRREPPPVKLSPSSLETLSVIAYRQPVTRQEIETIRGVSADAGLTRLLERELITITGRAELPGRPLQYGTTDRFLEFVGIRSLDELPASDILTSRQIDEWLKAAANPHKLGDVEMGLEDELPLQNSETAAQP
ncbi:MAG: SMC-Scp complex subunit ScpB [Opitutaceae bacterium]|jgi:segregation and condensation protein B